MLCNSSAEVVRNKIFWDRSIMVKGMDGAGNEVGQFLIRESLCVDHAADTNGGDKDMHLPQKVYTRDIYARD